MQFELSSELEDIVDSQVKSGRFGSANDVIREALQLLLAREQQLAYSNAQIRELIDEGWREAKAGDVMDCDEYFDRVDAELAALERSQT